MGSHDLADTSHQVPVRRKPPTWKQSFKLINSLIERCK